MEKTINYEVLEATRTAIIQDDLTKKLVEHRGGNRSDSLRQAILDYVVSGSYQVARNELESYIELKSEYPNFIRRSEKYKLHALNLISAIETKRNFPGLGALSLSKQQELHEKVLNHFEELKQVLRQIEVLDKEVKLSDIKATVWVLKTLSYSVFTIMGLAFFFEITQGTGESLSIVYSAFVDDVLDYVLSLF